MIRGERINVAKVVIGCKGKVSPTLSCKVSIGRDYGFETV